MRSQDYRDNRIGMHCMSQTDMPHAQRQTCCDSFAVDGFSAVEDMLFD